MDIIIGVPVYAGKSYVFSKFIENQIKIKNSTTFKTKIIFSTEDPDFASQLENQLKNTELDYSIVIFYRDPELNYQINNITLARESIRQEFLKTSAKFLAFIDSDLTFNINLLSILINKLNNYDVIYNSYLLHNNKVCNNGLGTCIIKREVLAKIKMRCSIFLKPYMYIDEGYYFEMDTLHAGFKIVQGAFVTSCHYSSNTEIHRLEPREKNRWEKTVHSRLARYSLSLFINIKPAIYLTARIRTILNVW
jgi:hypothetical protein